MCKLASSCVKNANRDDMRRERIIHNLKRIHSTTARDAKRIKIFIQNVIPKCI